MRETSREDLTISLAFKPQSNPAKKSAPGLDGHDDFLQRRVASPLANAVDRAFHLPGAVADGRQRIGDGQSQVVMAMDADDGLPD